MEGLPPRLLENVDLGMRRAGTSDAPAHPNGSQPGSSISRPRRRVRVSGDPVRKPSSKPLGAPPELRRARAAAATGLACTWSKCKVASGCGCKLTKPVDVTPDVYYLDPYGVGGNHDTKVTEENMSGEREAQGGPAPGSSVPAHEENICNICHAEFEDGIAEGRIECACISIKFCFKCISRWAQQSTDCPFCKTSFNKIVEITREDGLDCRREHTVEPRTLGIDLEEDEDDVEHDAYAETVLPSYRLASASNP